MMEKRTVKFVGWDESIINLKISKGAQMWIWKEQKCNSAFCRNHIFYILLNERDEAMLGYCPHGVGASHHLRVGQRWVIVNKGKFEEMTEREVHHGHIVVK